MKSDFNNSFDRYADEYNKARPQYPEELFNDLWQVCSISKKTSILEIGSGNGLATLKLTKKYKRIIALEPGKNLMKIAKERLKKYKNVSFVKNTFEGFKTFKTKERFDVITAFTSFHWIKDDIKFSKSASLLKDNGQIALVWFSFMQKESPVFKTINKAYYKFFANSHSKASVKEVNRMATTKTNERIKEIFSAKEFTVSFFRRYLNLYSYDGRGYAKLVNSFSDISCQKEAKRTPFLIEIESIVDKNKGISIPIVTLFVVAEKNTNF